MTMIGRVCELSSEASPGRYSQAAQNTSPEGKVISERIMIQDSTDVEGTMFRFRRNCEVGRR